ncbi:hypothetical protein F3Y22_tig00000132pilonHSYRG00019 [Hibiscus syriacus]|uniref:Uncharacterized protein n=1 Tax=Hibiscus syriacus TaxID=106335 RepID=A0A6A3DA92_HIBSY|nr:hypothetical protein F3Y22_tig00000132pilonHSYRG00019 [Hibiscus syriacus]
MEHVATSISTPVSVVSASGRLQCVTYLQLLYNLRGLLDGKDLLPQVLFDQHHLAETLLVVRLYHLVELAIAQNRDWIALILNVAEALDEQGAELMSGKQVYGLVPTASYTFSAFSANGMPLAPKMSSSAIYGASGSIPYIIDSGAPVVPQLMGSTSVVPIAYSSTVLMGMSNVSAGLNGSGPSQPNFDLNFGLAIEGGNTESMGLRHPFMPAQGRSIEEHLRANAQASSSSGVAMKRKEPALDGIHTHLPTDSSNSHGNNAWKIKEPIDFCGGELN